MVNLKITVEIEFESGFNQLKMFLRWFCCVNQLYNKLYDTDYVIGAV